MFSICFWNLCICAAGVFFRSGSSSVMLLSACTVTVHAYATTCHTNVIQCHTAELSQTFGQVIPAPFGEMVEGCLQGIFLETNDGHVHVPEEEKFSMI